MSLAIALALLGAFVIGVYAGAAFVGQPLRSKAFDRPGPIPVASAIPTAFRRRNPHR
jgi:hypothetical protein